MLFLKRNEVRLFPQSIKMLMLEIIKMNKKDGRKKKYIVQRILIMVRKTRIENVKKKIMIFLLTMI